MPQLFFTLMSQKDFPDFLPLPPALEYCEVIYGWPLRWKSFVWKIFLTLLAILLSIAFPTTSEPQLIFQLLSKGKQYNRYGACP